MNTIEQLIKATRAKAIGIAAGTSLLTLSAQAEIKVGYKSPLVTASYYADKFNGRLTASGVKFSNSLMTAAHKTLPFGTKIKVTNPETNKSVVVTINDRGPFTPGRSLDLSKAAFDRVGDRTKGLAKVKYTILEMPAKKKKGK